MNILLTNDDGINAEGINALYEFLSDHYNVCVIAPEKEMSACSNAFSIYSDLRLKRVDKNRYSVNGYPSDCVCLGIHSDLFFNPDIIVSGINHGPNLGDDQFFSGTVGGARSGFIYGKTGIAVSMNSYHRVSDYFNQASEFIKIFIDDISNGLSKGQLLFNINYPDLPKEKIKGVKYTFSGKRRYQDTFKSKKISEDEFIMTLEGTVGGDRLDGSDYAELEKGFISITPLGIDCTDYSYLKKRIPGNISASDKFFKLNN